MRQKRPVNLNLFTIHFPIPAIVSILHRVTGVVLFLCIPIFLWGLQYSLTSDGFDQYQRWLSNPFIKITIWLMLIPYCFHLIAGIRHLLSDIHIGDSLKMGRLTAYLTFIIAALLIIGMGIWIW